MDKIFFKEGETVRVNKLKNSPIMVVSGIQFSITKDNNQKQLIGVKCFWFTDNYQYQEQVFNTKDLEHVEAI